jgi:hypothetical protein
MSPRHPGMSPRHPGMSPRHPGMSPRHPGMSPRHSGTSARHPGMSPKHSGTSPRHSGTSARHPGMSPRHSGMSARQLCQNAAVSETKMCPRRAVEMAELTQKPPRLRRSCLSNLWNPTQTTIIPQRGSSFQRAPIVPRADVLSKETPRIEPVIFAKPSDRAAVSHLWV